MSKFRHRLHKPKPDYRPRKPDLLIGKERNLRIDRAQLLKRMAEQELLLGHERTAERLSGDAAELRDLTTTTTIGRLSGKPKEH